MTMLTLLGCSLNLTSLLETTRCVRIRVRLASGTQKKIMGLAHRQRIWWIEPHIDVHEWHTDPGRFIPGPSARPTSHGRSHAAGGL